MNINIPASKLRLSEKNVRKDAAQLNIEGLAADIAAKGLINNLFVEPLQRPKGHYAVLAGGRRLRAIQHNIETGVFPADYEVSCKVKDNETLSYEISLSENFQRQDMTPADEIVAFSNLAGEGQSSEDIARRFGLDKRNVDARLRLSHVAPAILDALRVGKITLAHVKAFAQAPTAEAQLQVFDNYSYWTPDQIHRHFTSETISASSAIARFVTDETYRAAGGRVELDLFSDDGAIWLDTDIAHQLASDGMSAIATKLLEQDKLAWVRPILATRVPWQDADKLHTVHLPRRALSEAESTLHDQLLEKYSDAEQRYNQAEENSDEEKTAAAEMEAIEKQLDDLEPGTVELSETARAQVGRFLVLTESGEAEYAPLIYSERRINIDGNGDVVAYATATTNHPVQPTISSDGTTVAEPAKPALSAKLADELKLQRRDVLAAHIASNPAMAMNYMLFSLAYAKMTHFGSSSSTGSTISPGSPQDGCSDYPKGAANDHLNAVFDALNTDWYNLPTITQRFDAFAKLGDDDKAAWVAYIMSTTLIANGGVGMSADHSLQAHVADLLQIDFAAMWRPTAANYFDRVKKDVILDALEQVGGETLRLRYNAAKKRELATTAETIFGGQAILDPEVKAAAVAWMPDELTFATELEANAKRLASADRNPDDEAGERFQDDDGSIGLEEGQDDDLADGDRPADDDDLDLAETSEMVADA
jgi:ParB family chromosome partitioning protein